MKKILIIVLDSKYNNCKMKEINISEAEKSTEITKALKILY